MYQVLIPRINPNGTYYLCNCRGGVTTVKGSDIHIHGHFVTEGKETGFKVQCIYTDCGEIYNIEQVKVKNGTLLVQVDCRNEDLRLSWYNKASGERVSRYVKHDLTLDRGVWVCKDYEPKLIAMATDDALTLPYNSYEYKYGKFRCDIDSGLFANYQVYDSSEDVRFYCRCHAVSDKSMAQYVRLTDEQLDELNARIKNLNDYCNEQGIRLVRNNDDGIVRAYKEDDLPEGYNVCIDSNTNGNPQSMTVPWSGLRRVDLDFDYVNSDWRVRLNYTEPKKEEK